MALTYTTKVGTGTSQVYDINWESELGYLDRSHVYVYTGEDYTDNNVPFTWINNYQIECVVEGSVEFTIRRVAPRSKAWLSYTDGAVLRMKNLDASFAQSLMIGEEITDGYLADEGDWALKGNLDMQGQRILNLGDPINPQDALTKGVADSQIDFESARFDTEQVYREARDHAQDVHNDAWNTGQDTRLRALETAIPSEPSYTNNYQYIALGGEVSLETNSNFGYALLTINGITQVIGYSFNILGSTLLLAEPLEEGDIVFAILSIPFAQRQPTTTDVDYLYTAVGGESQLDVGTSFSAILLTINGITQIPTKAFSFLGSLVTFAEALEQGDDVYAVLYR